MIFDITDKITLTSRGLLIPIRQYWMLDKLAQDKPLVCEIKEKKEKRSKSANDYCWVLCTAISEELSKERVTTKEDVYRRAVRESNCYYAMPIKDEKVEHFKRVWAANGIGWFAEEAYKSTLDGFTTMHAYYGSSEYDTKQMSWLIEFIVDEAKELGIETLTPDELARMKSEWNRS